MLQLIVHIEIRMNRKRRYSGNQSTPKSRRKRRDIKCELNMKVLLESRMSDGKLFLLEAFEQDLKISCIVCRRDAQANQRDRRAESTNCKMSSLPLLSAVSVEQPARYVSWSEQNLSESAVTPKPRQTEPFQNLWHRSKVGDRLQILEIANEEIKIFFSNRRIYPNG